MVDVVLLFGRIVLVALLYLFLLAAVRTGLGLVGGKPALGMKGLAVKVTKGPREIAGVSVPLDGTVIIGRSPDSDIVIADEFVSSSHARIVPAGEGFAVEDLDSTNGTRVNGQPATRPRPVQAGDVIEIGQNRLEVVQR